MTGVKKIFVSAAIAVMMMPGILSAQLRFENQDVSIISKLPTQYTGYVIHGSTGSTTVYYRVSAVVVGVGETKSNVITVADANAVRSSTNIVQLGWMPVEGATSYNIYRSTVSASTYFFLLRNVDKTILYYKDTGAANTSAYSAPNPRGGNLAVENDVTVGDDLTVAGDATVTGALTATITGASSLNVLKTGDTMSGPLTLSGSSLTVTGNAFSVGGSTLVVTGGKVGVGVASPLSSFMVAKQITEHPDSNKYGQIEATLTNPAYRMSMGYDATLNGGFLQAIINESAYRPIAINPRGGNVGIGTVSPLTKLHVDNGSPDNNTSDLLVNEDTWTNDATLELRSGAANIYSSSITWQGSAANLKITAGRSDLGAITLNTLVSGTVTERLRVLNGGTVAIVSGGLRSYSRTMAQLLAITPLAVGEQYFCNNCTPAKMVVSTGTSAGNFADIMGGTFQ